MTHSKWSGRACGFAVRGLSALRELAHAVAEFGWEEKRDPTVAMGLLSEF
jgi:hypothetical protein